MISPILVSFVLFNKYREKSLKGQTENSIVNVKNPD